MTTPIDKDYVCVIDQGQKKPISPITHTKTVWDEEKQKYIDSIIKDLEYTVGLPVTTSLDITEEGKYALDAVAGHRLNEICEEVFQSADDARNYFARIVGISDPENYNLTTLTNKVRDYMNKMAQVINNKSGKCPSNPTFDDLINSMLGLKNVLREYEYTFYLSYNDVMYSWKNNQNGTGIMDPYEPWAKNDNKNYIIFLSKKTLLKLSGKDYIPPSDNIIMAQFLYPEWQTKFNQFRSPIEHSCSYMRNYYAPYSCPGWIYAYPCMSVYTQIDPEKDKDTTEKVNSRYIYKEDLYGEKFGWDRDIQSPAHSPLNAFKKFGQYWDDNHLYVRLESNYIRQYWTYFLWDNGFDTTNFTKEQLKNLKDMRGECEIEDKYGGTNTYFMGIPFTLKLLALE